MYWTQTGPEDLITDLKKNKKIKKKKKGEKSAQPIC